MKYYWEWINKHYPGYVDSWQQFDQGMLFTKFVTDMMPWDEFKQCLSPHIDFGKATSMQSIKTFAVLNQIRVMMTGIFASSMPSWLQIIVVIELCKYCVPLAAQVDDAEEKWATDKKDANDVVDHHCYIQMLFTDAAQTKTMLDDACFAPMAGSVAVKLRQKNAQNAQKKKRESTAKPDTKGKITKSGGPRKSVLKMVGSAVGKVEDCSATVEAGGDVRARVWLDDLQSALHFALDEPSPHDLLHSSLKSVVSHAVRLALLFAFNEKSVTIAGVEYNKWSLLRKVVQRMVSSAHVAYTQAGGQGGTASLPLELGKLRTIVNDIASKPEDDDDASVLPAADVRQSTMDVLCSFSEADVTSMKDWSHGVGKRP